MNERDANRNRGGEPQASSTRSERSNAQATSVSNESLTNSGAAAGQEEESASSAAGSSGEGGGEVTEVTEVTQVRSVEVESEGAGESKSSRTDDGPTETKGPREE